MPELRQNFFTKEWVIIATERAKRPAELATHRVAAPVASFGETCPFCPGNEHKTPPEVLRSPANSGERPTEYSGVRHFHWYLSVIPRLTRVAGFELGSGMFINSVLPESAAEFLRKVEADKGVGAGRGSKEAVCSQLSAISWGGTFRRKGRSRGTVNLQKLTAES
jgi:UDPglucose--hexose-1-phosphate uridylyltransferase